MSINGVGANSPTTRPTESPAVGSPALGKARPKELDGTQFQSLPLIEEQAGFDATVSGMPTAAWPPAQSSPDAQRLMAEMEDMMNLAANAPTSDQDITLGQAMRKLKELMLKNRENELSLRDKEVVLSYDLKLQAIEKDKDAARLQFITAAVKGSLEIVSAGISFAGASKQLSSLKKLDTGNTNGPQTGLDKGVEKTLDKGLSQGLDKGIDKGLEQGLNKNVDVGLQRISAVAQKSQAWATGVQGASTIIGAGVEWKASTTRTEAEQLRAKADKVGQMLGQTNERATMARDVLLEVLRTEKEINDAITQAVNKRLSA